MDFDLFTHRPQLRVPPLRVCHRRRLTRCWGTGLPSHRRLSLQRLLLSARPLLHSHNCVGTKASQDFASRWKPMSARSVHSWSRITFSTERLLFRCLSAQVLAPFQSRKFVPGWVLPECADCLQFTACLTTHDACAVWPYIVATSILAALASFAIPTSASMANGTASPAHSEDSSSPSIPDSSEIEANMRSFTNGQPCVRRVGFLLDHLLLLPCRSMRVHQGPFYWILLLWTLL